ncbi:MAG: ankyrin repeat domain-containing protein [Alphaproteobacteria bacterium]
MKRIAAAASTGGSRTLADILASCSATLFPAGMGRTPVQVTSTDSDGDTPLHVVLRRQDSAAALMLIAAGAKVGAVGDMAETPLHIAVRLGDPQVVEALLAAGADPEARSEFGETPRSLAATRGRRMTALLGRK